MIKEKIKELESKIEAIVIAIPREQAAYEFYLELQEQYEDQSSRDMFEYLAKQELQHKANLETILNRLEKELKETKEEKKKGG